MENNSFRIANLHAQLKSYDFRTRQVQKHFPSLRELSI